MASVVCARPLAASAAGAEASGKPEVPLRAYRLVPEVPAGAPDEFELVARLGITGTIDHPIVGGGEEYARSFSSTPGTISADGVYLAGEYPPSC